MGLHFAERVKRETYLADAVDHRVEKSVDGLDLTLLLVGAEPHADSNDIALSARLLVNLGHASHINVQVTHVRGNFATGSVNDNNSSLDTNGNCSDWSFCLKAAYLHRG